MTTATLARDIKAAISNDIRRCAPAHVSITIDVALGNWQYFFSQGRYSEARTWWVVVHELMTGAR